MSKFTAAQLSLLFNSKSMKSEFIDVTPAMAAEWLEKRNNNNRKISQAHVDMLARAMKGKRWRTIHQGIAFDRKGNLIDGQHRLSAIVAAGVTVCLMVTFGCDPDDMAAADRQRSRSAADALAIFHQLTHPNNRAAIIRTLLAKGSGSRDKYDDQEIISEVMRHNAALDWFIATATARELWYAPYAGALVYAYERDPVNVNDFVTLLVKPVGLRDGSAVLATINMLRRRQDSKQAKVRFGGSTERARGFRMMLRAAAAFCANERILKIQDGEEGLKYFAKFPAAV